MGGVKSKPKAPELASFVTQPIVTPVQSAQNLVNAPVQASPEQIADEARKSGLLARDRSRFGTVLTSFRGLMMQGNNTSQRKTLLGE